LIDGVIVMARPSGMIDQVIEGAVDALNAVKGGPKDMQDCFVHRASAPPDSGFERFEYRGCFDRVQEYFLRRDARTNPMAAMIPERVGVILDCL
jgi:hypothetical protein